MSRIEQLSGLEILDSRGKPTVQATCHLTSGAVGTASAPSGASTGAAEALELRDGDPTRYRGLGCRKAVGHINGELNQALAGRDFASQAELDQAMIDLDGTTNKSRLGANAILAVSLAFARAVAVDQGRPLFQVFADILGVTPTLPQLTINLFSGGKHAGGQVAIQDVLVVPRSHQSMDEALAMIWAVYQSAADLTLAEYGTRALSADEGGLAPPFPDVETMLSDAVEAIEEAGYRPGDDVALAVDVASSHFYADGTYLLDDRPLSGHEMIVHVASWVERYPIISVEDGLSEDDWSNWPDLCKVLKGQAITLGDDFLCTNPQRIRRAIEEQAADALLLKVNQIGSLTEAAEAYCLARDAGWEVVVSARSGETEDNWLSDLAVGWSGNYIKVGSVTQSERLAKYNRLLEIEAGFKLKMV